MIGFSCPPLCFMPFREAAEMVSRHFGHWEMVSEAGHWLTDIECEVAAFLETTGMSMSVHGPFSDVNLAAFDERTRRFAVETICGVIKACHRLGIGPVTIHPGVIGPIQRYDREMVFRRTRKSLEEIMLYTGELGVGIAIENMPAMRTTICQTASEMERMMEGLEIGMCFDMGHAHISKQTRELLGLERRFINMHLHDNDGGPTDQHLAIGKGSIDFSILKGLPYRGNHIIEANKTDMAEAASSKRFLEDLLY